MTEERVWLTPEEAIARLPDGEHVHVFTRSMIGADWDRSAIVEMLTNARIEEAGRMAKTMGHGIAAWDSPTHCWLVETNEAP